MLPATMLTLPPGVLWLWRVLSSVGVLISCVVLMSRVSFAYYDAIRTLTGKVICSKVSRNIYRRVEERRAC